MEFHRANPGDSVCLDTENYKALLLNLAAVKQLVEGQDAVIDYYESCQF